MADTLSPQTKTQSSPSRDTVHDVDFIAEHDWKHVLNRFTEDMDPFDIDINLLAERLQRYVEKRKQYALQVPGRVILLAAIVLNMKTVRTFEDDASQDAADGSDVEWQEDEFFQEVDDVDTVGPHVETPPRAVPIPVKRVAERPVSRTELVDALEKAVEIKGKRSERQEERSEIDYGLEVREKDIQDRLTSLFSTLKGMLGKASDKVRFSQLVDDQEREEKLHRFIEVLHLESEEKIRCNQPEFFADIEILLQEGDGNAA